MHDVSKDNIEILERSRYTISSYRFVFGFPFKLPNCARCYVVNYVLVVAELLSAPPAGDVSDKDSSTAGPDSTTDR